MSKTKTKTKFTAAKLRSIGNITKRNALTTLIKSSRSCNKGLFEHHLKLLYVEVNGLWNKTDYDDFNTWVEDNNLATRDKTYGYMRDIVTNFSERAYEEIGQRLLTTINKTVDSNLIPDLFKNVVDPIIKSKSKSGSTYVTIDSTIRATLKVAIIRYSKKYCKSKHKAYITAKNNTTTVVQRRVQDKMANVIVKLKKEKKTELSKANKKIKSLEAKLKSRDKTITSLRKRLKAKS